MKFFPGLSFLSEKIRSPARGGQGSQGAGYSSESDSVDCSLPVNAPCDLCRGEDRAGPPLGGPRF